MSSASSAISSSGNSVRGLRGSSSRHSTETSRGSPSVAVAPRLGAVAEAETAAPASTASEVSLAADASFASSTRSRCSSFDLFQGMRMNASCRCVLRLGSPLFLAFLPGVVRERPPAFADVRRCAEACHTLFQIPARSKVSSLSKADAPGLGGRRDLRGPPESI